VVVVGASVASGAVVAGLVEVVAVGSLEPATLLVVDPGLVDAPASASGFPRKR
jgi:hypothetical protein